MLESRQCATDVRFQVIPEKFPIFQVTPGDDRPMTRKHSRQFQVLDVTKKPAKKSADGVNSR